MVAWDFGAFGARGLAGTGVCTRYGFGVVKALLLVDYGVLFIPPHYVMGGEIMPHYTQFSMKKLGPPHGGAGTGRLPPTRGNARGCEEKATNGAEGTPVNILVLTHTHI